MTFGSFGAPTGAKAYSHNRIASAAELNDPHGIVVLLFEGLLASLRKCRKAIEEKDYKEKAIHSNKAARIIDEGLLASIDPKADPKMAEQLSLTWVLVNKQIRKASVDNDLERLDGAITIVADLHGAWLQIGPRQNSQG